MDIYPEELDWSEMYRVMTSLVVPRPIGWVSSLSTDGDVNLAPFSFFSVACPRPPVVMFSTSGREEGWKDTPTNVRATGEFVVNLVTSDVAESMVETGAALDPVTDEFEHAGLEPAESKHVAPPRVARAKAVMECTLYDSLEVHTNLVVFGNVEYIHVDDDLVPDEKVDVAEVDAVGRLAGPYYTEMDRFVIE